MGARMLRALFSEETHPKALLSGVTACPDGMGAYSTMKGFVGSLMLAVADARETRRFLAASGRKARSP
jgi:hypothetical protein